MPVGALFKHWSLRVFAPDRMLRQTYEAFKTLLGHDISSHELMAEFAELYHEGRQEDFARVRGRYRQLAEAVVGMVTATGKVKQIDPPATDGTQLAAGVPADKLKAVETALFNAKLDIVVVTLFLTFVSVIILGCVWEWWRILSGAKKASLRESPYVALGESAM